MLRKLFRRLTPNRHRVINHPMIRPVGRYLSNPNLWHMNRRSVSGAVALGLFVAFLPIPAQMLVAAFGAVLLRVNLAISVAMVWISNPITMPLFIYAAFWVGALFIDTSLSLPDDKFTLSWALSQLNQIWLPLLTGSLILGLIAAGIGFALIRFLWRLNLTLHKRSKVAQRRARLNKLNPIRKDKSDD